MGGPGGSLTLANGQRFFVGTGATLSVPTPPDNPSRIPTSGWYMLSLGSPSVTTTGGFNHALEYIRSFSHAPRLCTIGAPAITGTSPNLRVTFPINVYYYVKGNGTAAVGGGAPSGGPGGPGPMGPPSGSGMGEGPAPMPSGGNSSGPGGNASGPGGNSGP
jgi:hypothetical protein